MQEILKMSDVLKIGLRGYKEFVDYNWHGKMISIRYLLSRQELYELLHNTYEMCVSSTGEFVPEFLDYSIRTCIVSSYTTVELPNDIDELYKLLYHSDLYDVVLSNANSGQIDSIRRYFEAL